MTSIGIVVINDNPAIDMAWQTLTESEAERMVTWLKDHHINARHFTSLSAWKNWSKSQSQR